MTVFFRVLLTGIVLSIYAQFGHGTITLTENSGVITFSTANFGSTQWLLSPSSRSSRIQIVFSSLFAQSIELFIYDQTAYSENGQVIYSCTSCGSISPPSFYSTSAAVGIRANYVGQVAGINNQFSLQFIAEQIAPSFINTLINLTMGMASINPVVSRVGLPPSTQQWLISPTFSASSSSNRIVLSFSQFTLPIQCGTISLNIYDSASRNKLLFSGCKQADLVAQQQWITSSGTMLITLQSFVLSNTNFTFTYYSDTTLYNCGSYIDPAYLTDSSFLISDGSATGDDMKRGQSCHWVIGPAFASSGTVTLIMQLLSIKNGGTLTVLDANGAVLYYCPSDCTIIPPPLRSAGNSLSVTYTSASEISLGYKGFLGVFNANSPMSIGSGESISYMFMSTAYSIVLPGDGASYVGNLNYSWLVSPQAATGPVSIVLGAVHISGCSDSFSIHDGPTTTATLLYRASCLDTVPREWIITSSTVALVTFTARSNAPSVPGGVEWSYFSDGPNYHCGFSLNPQTLTVDSMTITDGSKSSENIYARQSCAWSIVPPPGAKAIYISFERMDISGASLSIYAGNSSGAVVAAISNTAIVPVPLIVEASSVYITFTSGSIVSGKGFSLTYNSMIHPLSGPGDNTLVMASSSALSVVPYLGGNQSIPANTALLFVFQPQGASGSIYFSIISFTMASSSCDTYIEFFDGLTTASPSLGKYCANASGSLTPWVVSTQPRAAMALVSKSGITKGGVQFSYYSDGPNRNCGYNGNEGLVQTPSGIVTDGSPSTSPMYANQACRWLISPLTNYSSFTIAVELMSLDMLGGNVAIYDGRDAVTGSLIFECSGCSTAPGVLVARTGYLYIELTTSAAPMGKGYRLIYWTLSDSQDLSPIANVLALNAPSTFAIDSSVEANTSLSWRLPAISTTSSSLRYSSVLYVNRTIDVSAVAADGRPAGSALFASDAQLGGYCGEFESWHFTPYLVNAAMTMAATQYPRNFIRSSVATKLLVQVGLADEKPVSADTIDLPFASSKICKYLIDSGSSISVTVNVNAFVSVGGGRLRVYGGLYGNDALLLDTNSTTVANQQFIAPCGKALVIVEALPGNDFQYSLDLEYAINAGDNGAVCSSYYALLHPSTSSDIPWNTIIIAASVTASIILVAIVIYFLHDIKTNEAHRTVKAFVFGRDTRVAQADYPRFTPKLDSIKNKLLKRGMCCVCNEETKVLPLACGHAICLHDVSSYLDAALGDISMFPLKCPMHYSGCEVLIDANISKRVLNQNQYQRFLDFQDRAMFGEGMRCIFCHHYVNFPVESTATMVGCPHCEQRFCIRCKQAYSVYHKCPLEQVDDSLEQWKKQSGAQRCPTCRKLIEKEDDETCNHMVHKFTDGIPCIRERTDFCYLCGTEVAPNYPHNDVRGACEGLNHFPEGVYQKCRVAIEEEYRLTRLRSRKARKLAAVAPEPNPPPRSPGANRAHSDRIDRYFDI